jgi:hypothetical protein
LDVLNGGLGIIALFDIKKILNIFFSYKLFCNFWSSKPWIRLGYGSGSRSNEYGSATLPVTISTAALGLF